MELFVSCSLPSGLIRMLLPQTAKGAGDPDHCVVLALVVAVRLPLPALPLPLSLP
jgi:hypothetical protein